MMKVLPRKHFEIQIIKQLLTYYFAKKGEYVLFGWKIFESQIHSNTFGITHESKKVWVYYHSNRVEQILIYEILKRYHKNQSILPSGRIWDYQPLQNENWNYDKIL